MEDWSPESNDKVGDTSPVLGNNLILGSVIDAETQYFIAESTKSVDLVDNNRHEPGDDIWMGCASVSKAGRLCEK
jgi:hypothetical protein